MATVKLQGSIVSADYDDQMFEPYINRGIICPSSRFVAAIESATEPVDVYISSPGGDVFAGGEMLIALRKAAAVGKIRSVELGSMVASMAANIVASLRAGGVDVSAHANSHLMYHGCYTATVGGAQCHEDVATSLRNINDSVINDLNRIGIDNCRAWFAEGREKWIGAEEAKELGLITSIIEADAEAPTQARKTASRLAAFAFTLTSRKDYAMNIDDVIVKAEEPETTSVTAMEAKEETVDAVTSEPATPAEMTPDVPQSEAKEVSQESTEEVVQRLANERFAKLQASHDKKISDLMNERDLVKKDLVDARASVTSLTAEIAQLTASLAEVRDQLAAEKSAHENAIAKAFAPASAKASWTDAYRAARKPKAI